MDWRRPDRTTLGWALLFALPVGVGVAGAMMRGTGGGPLAPLVAGPAAVATLAVFLLVVWGASGGTEG